MSKLEERESRRRSSVIGSMVGGAPAEHAKPGRPKEDREITKRVSLSVLPSLYEDIRKIAYVQRRSISDIVEEQLQEYRKKCGKELLEYEKLKEHIL